MPVLGKRTRTEGSSSSGTSIRDIAHEQIDFEILIRQRVLRAAEARIHWAQSLAKALLAGEEHDGQTNSNALGAFQDAALASYERCGAAADFLVRAATPNADNMDLGNLLSPEDDDSEVEPVYRTQRVERELLFGDAPTPTGPLFLRQRTSADKELIITFACPACGRANFTNVHGLFNHCRMSHDLFFPSHDDCMRASGTMTPAEEIDNVLQTGIEVSLRGGVGLPSVRSLLSMAVGIPCSAVEHDETAPAQDTTPAGARVAHLANTLGIHAETPALAPFLGLQPRRKCIHVYDEDVDIEADHFDRSVWSVPHLHRHSTNTSSMLIDNLGDIPSAHEETELPCRCETEPWPVHSEPVSRFHLTRRFKISDHSQWIPPESRPVSQQHVTHRWMVKVESPSYGHHVSTFLQRATFESITSPPPPTFRDPVQVYAPPFAVLHTSDRPFLLKVTLHWAGTGPGESRNPATFVEHWVELDTRHTGRVTFGGDQTIDIDLDKSTVFLPRVDAPPLRWSDAQFGTYTASETSKSTETSQDVDALLSKHLADYPMTAKDLKRGATAIRLPYSLPSSPAQFLTFVTGRKRAIEWGRAHALGAAARESSQSPDSTKLSTGAVYRWLKAGGHFPQPAASSRTSAVFTTKEEVTEGRIEPNLNDLTRGDLFCAQCGVNMLWHLTHAPADAPAAPSRPVVNVNVLPQPRGTPHIMAQKRSDSASSGSMPQVSTARNQPWSFSPWPYPPFPHSVTQPPERGHNTILTFPSANGQQPQVPQYYYLWPSHLGVNPYDRSQKPAQSQAVAARTDKKGKPSKAARKQHVVPLIVPMAPLQSDEHSGSTKPLDAPNSSRYGATALYPQYTFNDSGNSSASASSITTSTCGTASPATGLRVASKSSHQPSFEPADLLAIANPKLTASIASSVLRLGLTCLTTSEDYFPGSTFGRARRATEHHLAPFALLSAVASFALRDIVAAAVDELKANPAARRARRAAPENTSPTAVVCLLPKHVMNGMLRMRDSMESRLPLLFRALARPGLPMTLADPDTEPLKTDASATAPAVVKMEED